MIDPYADRAQQARELLARSSPAAARAMRTREREAQVRARELAVEQERRKNDPWRWHWIDRQVERSIEAHPRLVEASPPESEPEPEVVVVAFYAGVEWLRKRWGIRVRRSREPADPPDS
ncbi:hypothetical protein [Nonomuraea basaltis]|uniref:hypothetical protein n=1 Tax=Nonomuraea basaltis TaxID=2495887 RepID=UPI00110C4490|nr:hypothetical protein [Nonomuraea basaltis]TMR89573.1 hypothetical protein EJK15_60010 [Nonomuraea basaltis]